MKTMKRMMVLVLSVLMVLGTTMVTSFAADITVTNATKGQTYKAYKIFNAVYSTDGKKVVYTVPSDLESKVSAPFSVGSAKASNGEKIVVLADNTSDADIIAWAKANYSEFDASGTALTFDATTGTAKATDLPAGYYFVTSSLGSMITLESVNAAAEVVDKNESTPNGPEKLITAETSSIDAALNMSASADNNKAAVGSTESFEVTFNATNWVQASDDDSTPDSASPDNNTKVTVWNFKDTPTGLDIDKSTVKVYVNGTQVTIPDANIVKGDDGSLSITIPWVDSNGVHLYETKTTGSALIPVKVTYDATVTADAATAVAPNSVNVKYNTDKNLGTDTTTTYTYKFKLNKLDQENKPLTGAEFQLFYGNSTTPLKFTMNNGKYQYDPNGTVTNIVPAGDNATAEIIGLDDATYTLKEVVVPNGYTQAADKTVSGLSRVDTADADITSVDVVNKEGTVLPSTGGMGTTILYIIGGVLVVVCGVMLVAKKRTSNK